MSMSVVMASSAVLIQDPETLDASMGCDSTDLAKLLLLIRHA